MKKREPCLALIATSVWLALLVACSAAPLSPVNVNSEGLAIKGYDTVAYFTLGKPVKGQKEFQLEWNNAKWLFASKNHLDLFGTDPEKYAPQYGGY